MISRSVVLLTLLIFIPISVYAEELYRFPDPLLGKAAEALRSKDFKSAYNQALKANPCSEQIFLLGVILSRQSNWHAAETQLSIAADSFQLLADYALLYQAEALIKLNKYKVALIPLKKIQKYYPDSPILRQANLLLADSYFETREFQSALDAYQQYIERYPAGNDSIRAAYFSALCRSQLGNRNQATTDLKKIWVNYPTSDYAKKAEREIQKLAGTNSPTDLLTADELYRRGVILYDLRRYNQSIKTFLNVPQNGQSEQFIGRLLLKTGQALSKAKRYKESEQLFNRLLARKVSREISDEALFWLAKVQDKLDKDDDAYTTYLKLADISPDSILADNALLEAAKIRKFQGKPVEMLPVLKRLLQSYARSYLKQQTTWELGWASYLTGDYTAAVDCFKMLTDNDLYREKALYWHAKSLASKGDLKGSHTSISSLLTNYPYSYYAIMARKNLLHEENVISPPTSFPTKISTLPLPYGFERVKALIAFGLIDEAKIELNYSKKHSPAKQKNYISIARLYLEMDDYAAAILHIKSEMPRKFDKDNATIWAVSYPLPYKELICKYAALNSINEELIFSLIRAESNFSKNALSPAGAIGLMQLMPATAATVIKGYNSKSVAPILTNPEQNIRLGVHHFRDLLKIYDGDMISSIAAYNAGTTNVNRWRRMFGNRKPDEFIENIPFDETREYVKKVLAVSEIYKRLYKFDCRPNLNQTPVLHKEEYRQIAYISEFSQTNYKQKLSGYDD